MQKHNNVRRLRPLAALLVVLVLVCGMSAVASACPSCQTALAEGESHGDYASGIYYSILFMLSMPFAITLTWAGFIYRAVKKQRAETGDQSPLV